jgi:hypothetical protein
MRPSAAVSIVKRCSGTRNKDRSARSQYANETASLKNFLSAELLIPGGLRNERLAISDPVLQLHRPFITERSSTPPATRRKFKSLGAPPPKNVPLKFQFSFRASK